MKLPTYFAPNGYAGPPVEDEGTHSFSDLFNMGSRSVEARTVDWQRRHVDEWCDIDIAEGVDVVVGDALVALDDFGYRNGDTWDVIRKRIERRAS